MSDRRRVYSGLGAPPVHPARSSDPLTASPDRHRQRGWFEGCTGFRFCYASIPIFRNPEEAAGLPQDGRNDLGELELTLRPVKS